MSNYYEALRKIRSSGKLKKPKSKIRSRGEISLEDLIREAEELDAKGKLSESDFSRMQELRNEVSNKLLGDRYTVEDIMDEAVSDLNSRPTKVKRVRARKEVSGNRNPNQFGGVMDDIDLDREIETGRDIDMIYEALLPREKVGERAVTPVSKSNKWDPMAQEETDLLAKYAKEDSLQRGRDKLKLQKDMLNSYVDMAYKEGYNDPESRRILFNAMGEIGSDYEDAIKMIKGDFSGFFENPRFANDPLIREAYEEYLYKKGAPIHKIDEFNRKAGGSIVSEKPLTDREKMINLLEDIEAQTGIDKMFAAKPRDDVSAVGGVVDETPAEIRGMSQMGRRQMNDDIKNKLVAFRTRSGEATGTEIDDVLLNPYLSNEDILNSKRYERWKNKKEATLKREQNIRPGVEIKPPKDVHPGPKWTPMRDVLIKKDRSELLEEAINDRYGSVDNLRKINSDVPEGAEHIVDEANSLLNAYDDAVDAERRWIDLEDNRHAESIADLLEDPAVIERKNPTPKSRDYGEETLRIRDEANKTRAEELQFIAEAAADKNLALSTKDRENILWQIRNRASTRAERRNISPVETLDEILNEMVRNKRATRSIGSKVTESGSKTPKKTRKQMIEEAVNESRNKGALSVRKFTPSGDEIGRFKVRKKDLLKEMKSENKGRKIDKDLGQSGMNISKWDKPATKLFIKNTFKRYKLEVTEQMINKMLRLTKQQVMDVAEDVADIKR